uniref:Beta-defensin n=1 Tax=Chlorocebus sabaeus TaxID=60711 RepID=A0A0D9RK38_CHLSB
MKPFLVTLAVLLLFFQVTAAVGSIEKCWNYHGSCRDECLKNEKVYVFCMSGKLCCLRPKDQPHLP